MKIMWMALAFDLFLHFAIISSPSAARSNYTLNLFKILILKVQTQSVNCAKQYLILIHSLQACITKFLSQYELIVEIKNN